MSHATNINPGIVNLLVVLIVLTIVINNSVISLNLNTNQRNNQQKITLSETYLANQIKNTAVRSSVRTTVRKNSSGPKSESSKVFTHPFTILSSNIASLSRQMVTYTVSSPTTNVLMQTLTQNNVVSLTFISPVNNSITNSATIDYSALDNTNMTVSIDGGSSNTTSTFNSGFTITGLADGVHNVTIELGNSTMNMVVVKTLFFTLDTRVPVINISSPANNSYQNANDIPLIYSVSDLHLSKLLIFIGGASNTSVMPSGRGFSTTPGYFNLTLYAVDSAGNFNVVTVFFTSENPTTTSTSIFTTNPSSSSVSATNNQSQNSTSNNSSSSINSINTGATPGFELEEVMIAVSSLLLFIKIRRRRVNK